MRIGGLRANLLLLLWIAFIVFVALTYLMRPIMEPDFFWHLKTGQWIWQHQSIPTSDPFSFVGPKNPDARQMVILQGYWLAQLGYYALYNLFGSWGVYLLRLIMFAAFCGLFFREFRHCRVNGVLVFSLSALFWVFFLENYALERPQVFSFLGIGLLLVLYRSFREHIDSFRRMHLPLYCGVFLLMLAWANVHPGVLLGQVALVGVVLVEGWYFVRGGAGDRLKFMVTFVALGLLGSFLTPTQTSLSSILSLLSLGERNAGTRYSATITEYYSIYTWLVKIGNYKLLVPVGLSIVAVSQCAVALRRRLYIEAVFLLASWLFAYRYVRYLPIAMVSSLLFVAWTWHPRAFLRYLSVPLLCCVFVAVLLWGGNETRYFRRTSGAGLVDPMVMPVNAANFLSKVSYRGRIYNSYNWGGYLMWRLSPEVQVAMDSRMLDEDAYLEFRDCEKNMPGSSGRPYWRDVMDKYQINVAVVPRFVGAKPAQIALLIDRDKTWRRVFVDDVSIVFARNIY